MPYPVEISEETTGLTRKENQLLKLLLENAGETVPRGIILMEVWGYQPQIRTRTLDVHIRRLRRKLSERSSRCIETVFGVGYRFQPCLAEEDGRT